MPVSSSPAGAELPKNPPCLVRQHLFPLAKLEAWMLTVCSRV
jgi:hypothetical protein